MRTDYGATVELDAVTSAMFRDLAEGRTTPNSRLREFPEGRRALSEMLQEERKNTPATIRRLPALMGCAAAKTVDALRIKVIRDALQD